ncbi:MAG TPA: protein-tyrosine-phosphatase [Kiritimatiellia bacterium]|nr:protein-tyrosine-phosphatase [Kiritimatiellia bacterium]
MSRPLRILFVCGRNNRRSPTAEKIYQFDRRLDVRAAGLADTSPRRVTQADIQWADLVLAMERKHLKRLLGLYGDLDPRPPFESLNIPDDYTFMNKTLVRLITEATEAALETFGVSP